MTKKRRKNEPTARLSEQMKEVLLWAFNYQNPVAEPTGPGFSLRVIHEPIKPRAGIPLDYLVNDRFAPWRPRVFIGDKPTQSKITALSNTLKRLEERGLVDRYSVGFDKNGRVTRIVSGRDENRRTRTTHVNLTQEGLQLAKNLAGIDFGERTNERDKVADLAEGLRVAMDLLNERLEQATTSEAKIDAQFALTAVEESLKQLKAEREFERVASR